MPLLNKSFSRLLPRITGFTAQLLLELQHDGYPKLFTFSIIFLSGKFIYH